MNCGCSKQYTCDSFTNNCATTCGSIFVENSFNMPACGSTAILSFPGLKYVQVGSYLYSPTYGYLKISSFNGVTGEMLVTNECQAVNPIPGTVIPAYSLFSISGPPAFGGWSTHATSITGNNTLTISSTILNQSEYRVNTVTKEVRYLFQASFTLSGAGTQLYINLPINIFGAVPSIYLGQGNLNSPSQNFAMVSVSRRAALASEAQITLDNSSPYVSGANVLSLDISYRGI